MEINDTIAHFLKQQGYVIVSTFDENGNIHCAAKGIVGLEQQGRVYLIDLFQAVTYKNLQKDSRITITSVDGHRCVGYSLQGRAQIVEKNKIQDHIMESWEEKVLQRISKRVVQNLKDETPENTHPEALFQSPKYLIKMDVESTIDLSPSHFKKK